jgi:hypothetical protein
MDGWMDQWMDELVDGWMDGLMDGCVSRYPVKSWTDVIIIPYARVYSSEIGAR